MNTLLNILILIPLLGFLTSLFAPKRNEVIISRIAFFSVGIQLAGIFFFTGYWLLNGYPTLNINDIVLFSSLDYVFFIDFSFDKITVVYSLVGAMLTFLVTIYSRYYMHREASYKRFFSTILFFYLGYTIAVFAGNFETLFIGWEILGICSFLLIAFYRDRYFPVKNAIKVFSVYRIGDVGLILAMWMSHHLWHTNITFIQLDTYELYHEAFETESWIGVFISMALLLTAAAKSAQLPFSSWLPRAMEGPTPSSAIFYGSLSVHLGVFLLMRTFPFWEQQFSVRVVIGLLGLSTSIIASLIARVQSSVKTQIAYASIAQIGIMFIELAAGFENLALFHFTGNAFLRTYQLLVSPSSVSYLIREQFFNFKPRRQTIEDSFPKKIEYTIYMWSVKEWNLDAFIYRFLWKPLKVAGKQLRFLSVKQLFYYFIPAYTIGLIILYFQDNILKEVHDYLAASFGIIGFIGVLKSFSERKDPRMAWVLIVMTHFWISLAISFNEHFKYTENLMYISGIIIAGIVGYFCIRRLRRFETNLDMNRFHGHAYEHPKIALVFLISSLALAGFPITSTFIGEDLIFSHIHETQFVLAFITSMCFIINGLALIRMYARIFLGPHEKTYHETPYRSS